MDDQGNNNACPTNVSTAEKKSINANLSLKLKIVFCKYLCTRFLGEIFDRIQLVPFFLTFQIEIEKENQNMFISASINLSGIFGRG